LLVGAGKMSEVAARTLTARGALLRVVNRDAERARRLAEACGGEPRPLEALATELAEADVVICSTAKPTFVISHELMVGVAKLRRHRPLFLIDIAVPRDVDPRVGELGDVFLYDLDDLQRVSHENLRQRERAAQAAEEIVSAEVAEYDRWLRTLDLGPTIVALRARVRETVRRELERAQPQTGTAPADGGRSLDALADRITGQLLHAPLAELKRANETEDGARVIELVQRMFRLGEHATATGAEEALATDPNLSPNRGERA
jgi:glutamyl-tRNA reductase